MNIKCAAVLVLGALAGLLLCAAPIFSQTSTTPPSPVSKEQIVKSADLLADLAILRQAYEELHPGLYRYNSKSEMDAKFAGLQAEFSRDRTLQDAYLALSIFAAQIGCGHSYPNFFNQKKAVAAALFEGQDRVPFYLHWIERKMIVTTDFTAEHNLPRGTQILSINGVPAGAILEKLITVARADGSNDAKRVAYLEVTGDSVYEAFDIYFPMFFPQKSTTLRMQVQKPGAPGPQTLEVPALTFQQRIAPIKTREESRNGGDEPIFEWNYLRDGSAYLRMPDWAMFNSKWDWKTWLNARLDELSRKNPPTLIIDLRGNEGGNDVGDEILKRVVRQDLKLSAFRRLVRYRDTPAELNPYLDTWDPSFKSWGAAAVELPQPWPTAPPVHYFALNKYDDDASGNEIIPAAGLPYRGKVFVLIDANNSSATFQFAKIVQENKLGTLVGQPTGGNQRGINGGAFFFLRLPNSQLEIDLPLIATFPPTPQPDAGLTPDILVTPTIADITAGRDAELAAIAQLK